MLLSIAMMVKNEERFLDNTLSALKPVLETLDSELVILDTGSSDKTIDIAKKYTDKVYSAVWNKNFADMRNKSISYCKGEWILIVDGDEVLENPKEIREFFEDNLHKKYNSAIVNIKNITSSKYSSYVMGSFFRLFKNDGDFKYIGRIHEQPLYKEPCVKLEAVFKHYGYSRDDHNIMIYKYERNIEILLEELGKNPKDIYILFQIAQTYSMARENKKALSVISDAIDIIGKEVNPKYIYIYHFYVKELLIAKKYK
ncbi:glycosyltransferase family 2 protein, partial [Clostridium sp.]|uniref:glycosyltransferase family 2 protein n=1 Tax=Clostridium sp. TaxID=1506 RepID=UPI003463A9E1